MYNDVRDLIGHKQLSKQAEPTQVTLNRLVEKQKKCNEGSVEWYRQQELINQIIADNFLEYVNRRA